MTIYFQEETKKAIKNFSVSGKSFSVLLAKNIALVKREAAVVNFELNWLDKKISQAIVKAADEMIGGKFEGQIVVDQVQGGAGTSMNMNVNEILAGRATEILNNKTVVHPLEHVNKSQSTNDVVPTALKITLIAMLDLLLESLRKYFFELNVKSSEFAKIMKVGRTHLQDAVPISLGREFKAQATAIGKDISRLESMRKELCELNIGGTAVGTMINCSPLYVKKMSRRLSLATGYPLKSARDMVYSTQYADVYLHLSSLLSVLSSSLIKFMNDLRLMSSGPRAGIGEVRFAPLQKGSTIMPGKVNPVLAEMLNQVAFQVAGNNLTIFLAVQAGQLELNVMLPIVAKNLFESLEWLSKSISTFTEKGLRTIIANSEYCRKTLKKSSVDITTLSKKIGYEKAENLLNISLKEDKNLEDLVIEKGIMSLSEYRRLKNDI